MTKEDVSLVSGRWYRAGMKLLKKGRYAEALRFFNQALVSPADNEAASHIWTNIGHCQHMLGHGDEALRSVDRALALNSRHIGALSLRAEILAARGSYQAAIEATEQAVTVAPEDSDAWAMRGRVLHLAGRDDEALVSDEQSLHLNPTNIWAWQGKIKILADQGHFEDALAACDQLLSTQSLSVDQQAHLLASKTHVLYNLGRHEEALTVGTEASQLDGTQAHTWELIGDSLGMLRRYDEAVDAGDKALRLDPLNAAIWSAKARWLYYLDRPLEALAAYDEAIRLLNSHTALASPTEMAMSPDNSASSNRSDAQVLAEAARGRARVLAMLFIRGNLPDEVDLFVEDRLNDGTVWREVAELLTWQRHDEEALAACAEALARNPHDFTAFKLKWVVLRRRHQYLEAFKVLWHVGRNARNLRGQD